jgi:putative hydrolase of the HAD superfamily
MGGAPADFDAVTIDAHGTLLALRDPIGHLDRELRARGVELTRGEIERGFAAEGRYYAAAKLAARDAAGLAALRTHCARVFLGAAGAALEPASFAPALAYEFELLPGVLDSLHRLAAHGLALAVIADWDVGLHEHLRSHGLTSRFDVIVVSAEVGAAKPDPAPFVAALERLGVEPGRALHIGDRDVDEQGAVAAGMHYLPAPLDGAVQQWLG